MTDILINTGYIALCVLLFSLAIFVHEFGHFIVALKLGLRVEKFSIGFGPALWKKTWRGVEYRVSAIPLGGYVSIPDVDPEGAKRLEGGGATDAGLRSRISPWKEIAVAVAGPAMNVALAVVLAFVLAVAPGARFGETPAHIDLVFPGGPAEKGGMRPGDTVLSVGGRQVRSWTDMQVEVQISGGRATAFEVAGADGERRLLTITPEVHAASGACVIQAAATNTPGAAAWMVARDPLRQLAWDAGSIFRVLKGLCTPREAKAIAKNVGGPVVIAQVLYAKVRDNVWDAVGFLRYINVNLAVLNLLPIPVLDGGLILFAFLAVVFRRRLPEKVVSNLTIAFMVVLMGLMAILFYRDGLRAWRMHREAKTAAESAEAGAKAPAAESAADAISGQ